MTFAADTSCNRYCRRPKMEIKLAFYFIEHLLNVSFKLILKSNGAHVDFA